MANTATSTEHKMASHISGIFCRAAGNDLQTANEKKKRERRKKR
jgi:hypothetical protein